MSNRKTIPAPRPVPVGPGSDEDFEYDSPAGPITVPSLATIKAGIIRRARKLDPADQAFTLIEAAASPEALEVVDELRAGELNEFMQAWVEHSGTTLGE